MPDFRDVDPRELHLPPAREQGADTAKLARQISLFGSSAAGMPPPWVFEGTDGVLVLYNGVTRATRIAKVVAWNADSSRSCRETAASICVTPESWRLTSMTSETQRAALRVLAEVWALSPDVRLGQLMAFLGFLGEDQFEKGLGYIEDDEMMAVLNRHKADLIARGSSPPIPSVPAGDTAVVASSPLQTS
jgi:hypothetical protein